ncbi:MAG TPA: AtpZ/AtpI family protein [Candidatus Wallbacteria bacterium]|nr:AtpZ/AtpI family protein [Candidatus Wallbacteria bacterium]
MNESGENKNRNSREEFIKRVETKEKIILDGRRDSKSNVWLGFVKYGFIGWAVSVPMLAGVAGGLWLDKNYPSPHSWTLSLMALGLFIGCACAWRWVEKEGDKIKNDSAERNEENKMKNDNEIK